MRFHGPARNGAPAGSGPAPDAGFRRLGTLLPGDGILTEPGHAAEPLAGPDADIDFPLFTRTMPGRGAWHPPSVVRRRDRLRADGRRGRRHAYQCQGLQAAARGLAGRRDDHARCDWRRSPQPRKRGWRFARRDAGARRAGRNSVYPAQSRLPCRLRFAGNERCHRHPENNPPASAPPGRPLRLRIGCTIGPNPVVRSLSHASRRRVRRWATPGRFRRTRGNRGHRKLQTWSRRVACGIL